MTNTTPPETALSLLDELCSIFLDTGFAKNVATIKTAKFKQKAAELKAILQQPKTKRIVMCGSSRFTDVMAVCAWFIERDEHAITNGLHLLPSWYTNAESHLAEAEGVAEAMDDLHLQKIDSADEVFVVNCNHYIGESTTKEVEYAKSKGIHIRWFTSDPLGEKVNQIIQGKLAEQQPKNLTEEEFEVMVDKARLALQDMRVINYSDLAKKIYQALLPHLASAQAAQGHEAIRIAVANYVQSEGCDCCQGGNHSEHKKALAELLKVPMYSDGSGYDFNAILAANEQDGK